MIKNIENYKIRIVFQDVDKDGVLESKSISSIVGTGTLFDVIENNGRKDFEDSFFIPNEETENKITKLLNDNNFEDIESSETNVNNYGDDNYYEIYIREI